MSKNKQSAEPTEVMEEVLGDPALWTQIRSPNKSKAKASDFMETTPQPSPEGSQLSERSNRPMPPTQAGSPALSGLTSVSPNRFEVLQEESDDEEGKEVVEKEESIESTQPAVARKLGKPSRIPIIKTKQNVTKGSQSTLSGSSESQVEDSTYSCPLPGCRSKTQFKTKAALCEHLRKCHDEKWDIEKFFNREFGMIHCPRCGKVYMRKGLAVHLGTCLGRKETRATAAVKKVAAEKTNSKYTPRPKSSSSRPVPKTKVPESSQNDNDSLPPSSEPNGDYEEEDDNNNNDGNDGDDDDGNGDDPAQRQNIRRDRQRELRITAVNKQREADENENNERRVNRVPLIPTWIHCINRKQLPVKSIPQAGREEFIKLLLALLKRYSDELEKEIPSIVVLEACEQALFNLPSIIASPAQRTHKGSRIAIICHDLNKDDIAANINSYFISLMTQRADFEQKKRGGKKAQRYDTERDDFGEPIFAADAVERDDGAQAAAMRQKAKRAIALAKEGRTGAAVAQLAAASLNSSVLTPGQMKEPWVIAKIEELHPPATEEDAFSDTAKEHLNNSVKLSIMEMTIVLNDLPNLSASGMSGWTNELLKRITNPEVLAAWRRLFNNILVGKGGPQSRWTRSRLVAIRKPGADKKALRPIAMGEILYRFLGRSVARHVATAVGETLCPLQVGVGMPGGVEIIAHAATMVYESMIKQKHDEPDLVFGDRTAILTLDGTNAFNRIGRGTMFRQVLASGLGLTNIFRWGYGKESALCNSDGDQITISATGVRQGDPLSGIYYAIGFQPLLTAIAEKECLADCTVMAYFDDITITGPVCQLTDAYKYIHQYGPLFGYHVNCRKSYMLFADRPTDRKKDLRSVLRCVLDSSGEYELGPVCRCDGVEIVGASIGTDNYIEKMLATKRRAQQSTLQIIADYTPTHLAFILTTSVVNSKLIHLTRTHQPRQTDDTARRSDRFIDSVLHRYCTKGSEHDEFPAIAKAVRGLPISMGGCGLRRLEDIQKSAFVSAFLPAMAFMAQHHAALWRKVCDSVLNRGKKEPSNRGDDYECGELEMLCMEKFDRFKGFDANLGVRLPDVGTEQTVMPAPEPGQNSKVKKFIRRMTEGKNGDRSAYDQSSLQEKTDQQVLKQLLEHPDLAVGTALRAFLLDGACRGSAPFLTTAGYSDGTTRMTDQAFCDLFRVRLLMGIFEPADVAGSIFHCICGGNRVEFKCIPKRINMVEDPFHHYSTCGVNRGRATARHEDVRKGLIQYIRASKPTAVIEVERQLPGAGGALTDITVKEDTKTTHIDIAVVHSATNAHRRKVTAEHPEGAVAHKEKDKDMHYARALGYEGPDSCKRAAQKVIMFVVSTNGRFGDRAQAYMNSLADRDANGRIVKPDPATGRRLRRAKRDMINQVYKHGAREAALFRARVSRIPRPVQGERGGVGGRRGIGGEDAGEREEEQQEMDDGDEERDGPRDVPTQDTNERECAILAKMPVNLPARGGRLVRGEDHDWELAHT